MLRKRIKRQSAVNTEINHSIQSTVNKEKASKIHDIISSRSIRLVDIAKSYRKQETSLTEAFMVKDEQNQFYVDRNSAKETSVINNKRYTKKMMDKKDSLNSNYKPKNAFITDTEEIECNDKISVSNLYNINVTDNNFAASSSKTENTLDVSERTECSDKANISSISDISNIIDSSLISYLNDESICTPSTISKTLCESFLKIDEQTHCNTNDELKEKSLNENHKDNKIIDTENEVLPLQINKEKLLSMKTTLDKKHTYRNMIEDNFPTTNTEMKDKIKNDLKKNKMRNNFISNICRVSTDCNDNIKNSVFLSKTNEIDAQSKQIYTAETVLCNVQKDDITTEESKKQSCSFLQLDKDCFQQLTGIIEQEESLIKMTKNIQDISILHSVSKDMHNKKTTAHLDYYDCNNNSKEIAPKCIISEDIIYRTPKYIILKTTPTKTDQKEDGQEILKSPERKKYRLSNKEDNKQIKRIYLKIRLIFASE